MSYALHISPRAEQQLAGQPDPLRTFTLESLRRLAASPSAFRRGSRASTPGQIAEFRFDQEPGVSVWVTITFLYGSDEQTLHIEYIATEFGV